MWQIIIGVSLVVLAASLHGAKTFDEGFKATKAVTKVAPKAVPNSAPKLAPNSAQKAVPNYATNTVTKAAPTTVNFAPVSITSEAQPAARAAVPASVMMQGFQSYQNPYNSSPATQQTLEFRLGQNSYSKQVQNGRLM